MSGDNEHFAVVTVNKYNTHGDVEGEEDKILQIFSPDKFEERIEKIQKENGIKFKDFIPIMIST